MKSLLVVFGLLMASHSAFANDVILCSGQNGDEKVAVIFDPSDIKLTIMKKTRTTLGFNSSSVQFPKKALVLEQNDSHATIVHSRSNSSVFTYVPDPFQPLKAHLSQTNQDNQIEVDLTCF